MSKPTILFRGPVETRSGYGAHARDILEALYLLNQYDIKIDSCLWGSTPLTALEDGNEFHNWIKKNTIQQFNGLPDIYIQVTIPSEFRRFGKVNIGITAGIETTVAPKDWIDGCNRMDLVITTSNFSRDVLISTVYNENENTTGRLIKQHRIDKEVKVLFEGVDTKIYNDQYQNFDLDIEEDFAFLFVGHWLKGNLGQDRKDVGMLIKCFADSFKGTDNPPALILKTSSATFSVKERESFRKKIEQVCNGILNPPPIYLLFGELTNTEMNQLYNHPKVKAMVSITKGEGFGRPLLEFTMTGKPVIASNWSGHKDFLTNDNSIMIGGKITDVDDSAVDNFIIKGSKWFTANYDELIQVFKLVTKDYQKFLDKSLKLKEVNKKDFSLDAMKDKLKDILKPYSSAPKEQKLILPKLNKVG